MAIDFSVLQQGSGLPNILGVVQQQEQQAAQLQAQRQQRQESSASDFFAAKADARADAKSALELKRLDQAIKFDANDDNRAERETSSVIGNRDKLTNNTIKKTDSDIELGWAQFGVATDIAYQDLGLRKEDQAFNHNLKTEQFQFDKSMKTEMQGYQIKWGESADKREDRKVSFAEDMALEQVAQEREFKAKLANAVAVGGDEITKTLMANGMFNQAKTYTEMGLAVEEGKIKKATGQDAKVEEAFKAQVFPKILSGEQIDPVTAANYNKMVYGEAFSSSLAPEEQSKVATVDMLRRYGKELSNISSDPMSMAVMAQNKVEGVKYNIPLSSGEQGDKNKFTQATYAAATVSKRIDTSLGVLEAFTKTDEIAGKVAGLGPSAWTAFAADAGDAINIVGSAAGIKIDSFESYSRARDVLEGYKQGVATLLAQGDKVNGTANARSYKAMLEAGDLSGEGISAFRQSLQLSTPMAMGDALKEYSAKNPGASYQDTLDFVQNRYQKYEDKYNSRFGQSAVTTGAPKPPSASQYSYDDLVREQQRRRNAQYQ